MRAPILVAAFLVLSACGKNDQADNMQNVDDNLSADSIVSNDVTAIDAVTGDAANMAADVDMNYGNLDVGPTETALNEGSAKPSRPTPKKPAAAKAATNSAAATTANTATNAE